MRHYHFSFNKIIRDSLPPMMGQSGINVVYHAMDSEEYLKKLKDKLMEEVDEVCAAQSPKEMLEELGDVLEVLVALAAHHHVDFSHITSLAEEKKREKGGFENPVCIDHIEVPEDHPKLAYYTQRPKAYPQTHKPLD